MIFVDDIELALERNLGLKVERSELLALATDLNAIQMREIEASRKRQLAIAEEKVCQVQHNCRATCFKWKMVTVVGWIIALGSLLSLSLLGL